jgi:hypothetical protein
LIKPKIRYHKVKVNKSGKNSQVISFQKGKEKPENIFRKIFNFLKEKLKIGKKVKEFNDLLNRNSRIQESSNTIQEKGLNLLDEIINTAENTNKTNKLTVNQHKEFSSRFNKIFKELEKEKSNLNQTKERLVKHEKELNERDQKLRKEEIYLAGKQSEIRKREHELKRNEIDFVKREKEFKDEANRVYELDMEFTGRKNDLAKKEMEITYKEKDILKRDKYIKDKNHEINNRLKSIKIKEDEIDKIKIMFEKQKVEFEKKRENFKKKFEEKIKECETKTREAESIKHTVGLFEKDISEEGKEEKLVVGEALRQVEKSLLDNLEHIQSIQEKYGEGTFKGFSIPLDKIEESIEELTLNIELIDEYYESNSDLPLKDFIRSIKKLFKQSVNSKDLWEFESSYTFAIKGIAISETLETFINGIKSIYDDAENEEEETEEPKREYDTNYYEVLNVSKDSTDELIKKAYREMVKKYHPDKNRDNLAKEMFEKIQEAYEILSDEGKREHYDNVYFK